MIDLQVSRAKIDEIDSEIVRLFEERMAVCEAVAEFKIETGKEVLDVSREQSKLKAIRKKAHGAFNELGTTELFQQIMAISRKRQYQLLTQNGIMPKSSFREVPELNKSNIHAVYQGVPGAYSYAAMRKFFGKSVESHNVKTWRQALEDVAHKKADYAVLPMENSTAGIVSEIYDLLTEYNLFIVGEQVLRVDHVLLGLPGADKENIVQVYSHPQGLAQCRKFLEKHLNWTTNEVGNTAVAAKNVKDSNDVTCAAIASRDAGELYGLEVLEENICNNKWNFTRFVIIGREAVYETASDKISVCFELPHSHGTLYSMLSHIIYNGLNMTKIESRPIPGKPWQYRFYVDFNGNLNDSAVTNTLRGLESETNDFQIFGNYVSDIEQ